MKKNIKNLLLLMIVLLGVFTLSGCGNKYKYPNETPKVTNPNEVVLTIPNKNATATPKIIPATNPAHAPKTLFFGEIVGQSFVFPNLIPKKYANVSVAKTIE